MIDNGRLGACPQSCPASDCAPSQLIGTDCQAHCEDTLISDPIDGDGCCPEKADASSDSDCKAVCGNGVVEGTESCDPPETCTQAALCGAAPEECWKNVLTVLADPCHVKCEMKAVNVCVSGDDCCPAECTSANDDDCTATCGDGRIDTEADETCDPPDTCVQRCDDKDSCTDDITTGSAAACNLRCWNVERRILQHSDGCCPKLDAANANNDNDCPPECGNNIREPNERCDGKCPSDAAQCDDQKSCTTDELVGEDCQRECRNVPKKASLDADGCCPTGASQMVDPDCVNLLEGKVFESSVDPSTTEPNHDVKLMTDGDEGTRWISQPYSPVHLTVDLGRTVTLRGIEIIWAGDTIETFTLEMSDDKSNWTVVRRGTTTGKMVEPAYYEVFEKTPTGRYFQIVGHERRNPRWGNSIYEVRLYGN